MHNYFTNDLLIDAASILIFGRKKYQDEIGQLWIKLTDYDIKIRSITKLDQLLKIKSSQEDEVKIANDLLLKMNRSDEVLERRPILCILRQNKYNVEEWLKRIQLVKGDERMALKTFTEVFETVEPNLTANGKLSDIWMAYAEYYGEKIGKLVVQSSIRDRRQNFKIQKSMYTSGLNWLKYYFQMDFLTIPFLSYGLFKKYIQKEVLEILNHQEQPTSAWLIESQDNALYEESFKIFEEGVQLFDWPALYEIIYITKFIQRYRGKKLREQEICSKLQLNKFQKMQQLQKIVLGQNGSLQIKTPKQLQIQELQKQDLCLRVPFKRLNL
ncbi:unnamed protein product [Paramecium pentaurelia]|uniref:Uncharacterized protein n=1 Tax=Paramecium pentaurelia TaxID=43138 RepID=A0A8S1W7D4_9CILI|nr:unnamed protein product [Paramecium pentaurelia]